MTGWLPSGFMPPAGAAVPYGHQLRPVRLSDGPRLCVATPGLSLADAQRLLQARLAETERRSAFTFALLDTDATALLGEVRIEPPTAVEGSPDGSDAVVTWWVVPECEGTDLARAFAQMLPSWLASDWPFTAPVIRGRPR